MRNILAVAGRGKLADPQHEKLSNKALGLSGGSRDGTKIAISAEHYLAAVSCAEIQDAGVAAALLRGEARVRVVFGTKGGRPRDTTVIDREKCCTQ